MVTPTAKTNPAGTQTSPIRVVLLTDSFTGAADCTHSSHGSDGFSAHTGRKFSHPGTDILDTLQRRVLLGSSLSAWGQI